MFFKDIFSFNEEQKVSYPTRVSYLGLKTDPSITDGPVAQRIRHLTTNQGIPGSNPGGVEVLYFCPVLLRNSKKGYKWWSYWQHEPSPTLLITVSLLFGQRFWWTHFYRLCGEGDIKRSAWWTLLLLLVYRAHSDKNQAIQQKFAKVDFLAYVWRRS